MKNNILNWIWQFPQNIIGLILYIICKKKGNQTYKYKSARVAVWYFECGVSFGNYIFIPIWAQLFDKDYVKHEYGHSLQSKKLGWLYVFIIFLPSMIWNRFFEKYRQKHNICYYSFYTEKWADSLAGVERR
jgi:hypothetical protein